MSVGNDMDVIETAPEICIEASGASGGGDAAEFEVSRRQGRNFHF